ncbi:MAG: hypothetical protein A2V67_19840 [Deltaproteobacteria bacterium RBG_13_61_14]|nr:MAG: hypothetical protein A2V67_19840 [Deltaproteobacteria bacterium RBG_13_61_14]
MNWLKQTWLQAGLIVVFTWVVYSNALPGDFYFDDIHHVQENLALQVQVSLGRLFTDPQTFSSRLGVQMYRPLTLLSYAATFALFGSKPLGFHLLNLLIHSLNALLVFFLARRWLKDQVLSWLLALTFAVATVNTMAVNYISSRSDLLAAGWVLLALFLDDGPVPDPGPYPSFRRAGAILAAALGLLSKETAMVLPALIVARDFLLFPRDRSWLSKRIAIYLAYGLVAVGFLALRYFLIHTRFGSADLSLLTNLLTQLKAVLLYFAKVFFPFHLSILPDLPAASSLLQAGVIAAAFGILALLFMIALSARSLPLVALGLAWFLLSLLPTSLVPLHLPFSETRVYLGSVGLLLAAFSLLFRALEQTRPERRRAAWSWLVLIILIQAGWTRERNTTWQDGYRLWAEATRLGPGRPLTLVQMAALAQERKQLPRAKMLLARAYQAAPDDPGVLFQIAQVYQETGPAQKARTFLEKYLEQVTSPGDRIRAEIQLARLDLHDNRLEDARAQLEQVLAVSPDEPWALYLMGLLAELEKNLEAAADYYRRALVALPRFPEAEGRLGTVLTQLGQNEEAQPFLEQAVAHGSLDERVYLHLGNLYGTQSRLEEAKDMMERALALNPNYALGHLNLGVIYFQRGDYMAAKKEFEEALRLDPSMAQAHGQLARWYLAVVKDRIPAAMTPEEALALAREQIRWLSEHGYATSELDAALQALEGTAK